jgi:membrane protein
MDLNPSEKVNHWQVLKMTARNLAANDLFRMAGATAFFTTFALPPMLIIVVRTLGLFVERRTVARAIMESLRQVFGMQSVESLRQTIRSFRDLLEGNALMSMLIFLFLVFVATSLFTIIRKSINQLWCIRIARSGNAWDILKSRAISMVVILAGGLLFLGIQVVVAGQDLLTKQLSTFHGGPNAAVWRVVTITASGVVAAVWLYLLFTLLPDGRPNKKIAMIGALSTAVLFTGGKQILQVLLQPVRFSNFYGMSGALALVLLFMFYSSIFLYVGAALIDALSKARKQPVVPKRHAERYEIVVVE